MLSLCVSVCVLSLCVESVCESVCVCVCAQPSYPQVALHPEGGWYRPPTHCRQVFFLTFRQRDRRWRRRLGRGGLQVSLMSTVHCHNKSMGKQKSDCADSTVRDILASQEATSSQISTVTRARLSLRFLPVSRESDIRPTCGV